MEQVSVMVGLGGVAVQLVTYALLASGRLSNDDWRYPVLNIIGTLGLAYSLLYQWNLPSMVSQLMWIAISIIGLMRIARKAKKARA